MRYIFPFLCLSLLVLTGCKENDNESSIFSSVDSNYSNSTNSQKIEIGWNELLKQFENRYFVYVYSKTCKHCIKLEPLMNEYVSTSTDKFYFIEYKEDIVPLGLDHKNTVGMDNIETLYIKGTPTLFEIENKKVKNCYCGYNEISNYIENN